jgi:hypothetical protein
MTSIYLLLAKHVGAARLLRHENLAEYRSNVVTTVFSGPARLTVR